MKSIVNIYVLAMLFAGIAFHGISNNAYADMEAKLATSNGTDAFVIQDSSGSSLMSIFSNGNVGIGTSSPQNSLQIHNTTGNDHLVLTGTMPAIQFSEYENGIERVVIGLATTNGDFVINSAKWDFIFQNISGGDLILATSGTAGERMRIKNVTGNVGIGTTNPSEKLEVAGNIKASGTITEGSSRTLKKDISYISTNEAIEALNGLNPVKFKYKTDTNAEEHLGFIAEDVPDLVSIKGRKALRSMDITAVLTKVVKEQQGRLLMQEETLQKQQEEIRQLKEAIGL